MIDETAVAWIYSSVRESSNGPLPTPNIPRYTIKWGDEEDMKNILIMLAHALQEFPQRLQKIFLETLLDLEEAK